MSSAECRDFERTRGILLRAVEGLLGGTVPQPEPMETETELRWVRLLDAALCPDRFRRVMERLNPDREQLQALVRYFAGKRPLEEEDIERLEWLVTYCFRSPAGGNGHSPTSEMLKEIRRWFAQEPEQLTGTSEALLEDLVVTLQDIAGCSTFKELTHSGLIGRGRGIKQKFKEEFAHPAVLAAVVNYNLVSGRKFEQLLSEALTASSDLPLDLPSRDYRSAAEDFRRWSATASPAPAAPENHKSSSPQPLAPPAPKVDSGINLLGIDTMTQEGQFLTMLNELSGFARSAGNSFSLLPLPHSHLPLSPWEAQSLVAEYPVTEKSFRANFNRAVRRAVGLLAGIQEETAQYRAKRDSAHLWKRHIDALVYLLYSGRESLAVLDKLSQDAASRGLGEKSEQLNQTGGKLKAKLDEVAEICREWKEQWAHNRPYAA